LITELRIASGLEIRGVHDKFDYLRKSGYREYDSAPVEPDSELRASEASLCVWLNSRISGNDLAEIWKNRPQIEHALRDVPNDVDLLGLSDSRFADLADVILRVIRLTICHRVKLSKATKILHKKRPLLIPILDNIITDYYDDGPLAGRRFQKGGRYYEYLRCFRDDLESVGRELRGIDGNSSNLELTHCRTLEFLMWKQRMENLKRPH
jgi:hypothetical protein